MRRLTIARHWFQDGGFRMIVVLKRGPKWARVLDAGTLRALKIPSNDLDLYAEPLPVSPRNELTTNACCGVTWTYSQKQGGLTRLRAKP